MAALAVADAPEATERREPRDSGDPPASSAMLGLSSRMQPVSCFFGQTGTAYEVVYVVDVSASLMIYVDDIARELRDSIRALVPTQRFHIVLARANGEVEEFQPKGTAQLVPALPRYKAEAVEFVDRVRGAPGPGAADPVEAMKRAFAVEPELIYFLTDGDYPTLTAALEDTLRALNRDGAVQITTIGFDPSHRTRQLLERIAQTHGGRCHVPEGK